MNRIRKLLFAILSVAVLVISLVAVWVQATINECSALQGTPSVPQYPGSVLVEQREGFGPREDYSLLLAMLGGSRIRARLVTVDYSVDAPAQSIIDFYTAQAAECRGNFEDSARVMCHKDLPVPSGNYVYSGRYYVYIDRVTELNSSHVFTIEIMWFSCGTVDDA